MGVKQLWTLLNPAGRPVLLETMEGKTVAIDSSIWIYQFQATMRDKDGRALVNAHVLGFLRRICKLLFYGIKPVFVFDGGAPALKKHTITERKRKKAGAVDSHSKLAQKLLAAQMRREALLHVQTGKQKAENTHVTPAENTVYLEDLVANPATAKPESAKKKNKFHDYDPYRLPEVVSHAINPLVPDPRLATEEELRQFIDTMRPEDFDVSSPAFRELPTEVQYEIIGDLRLKSRQTSHKRLQAMLRTSRTPLAFSEAQIQNLKLRNTLTQQLLETTDSIGRANVVIPVRIASERNKEYVLIRNEGVEGGWILGTNNEGSRDKPIELDEPYQETLDDEDSDEMEEVDTTRVNFNPDLENRHGCMALTVAAQQHSHEEISPEPSAPLSDDDVAIQEVLIQQAEAAAEERRRLKGVIQVSADIDVPSQEPLSVMSIPDDDDDDLYVTGLSGLDTALTFANTPSRREHISSTFGTPILLLEPKLHFSPLVEERRSPENIIPRKNEMTDESDDDDSDMDAEEVSLTKFSPRPVPVTGTTMVASGLSKTDTTPSNDIFSAVPPIPRIQTDTESEKSEYDVEIVKRPPLEHPKKNPLQLIASFSSLTTTSARVTPLDEIFRENTLLSIEKENELLPTTKDTPKDVPLRLIEKENELLPITKDAPEDISVVRNLKTGQSLGNVGLAHDHETPVPNVSRLPEDVPQDVEVWDAAEEMDIVAEEGDFAELVSQMKNQDIETAQKEIDEEIKQLNKQRKAAMRDSEDVTQHMISQIMLMLRLFGLPYITAPMEAEAQCAALVSLGLVDGIITDDSDVFLFGGLRVYKNMFNQSKTVECFLLSDLGRELGLDRDTLIRLAYLLGSDYVEGLPGVGPVVAMELLREFPGENGLHKFNAWWQKVQSGKDNDSDTNTKFKERFKKRFKNLYLSDEWPNAGVRDAYCHPTIDESEEPFKWGLPDLDALHQFFHDELSWPQNKVDELLVPIIRKMGQRNQTGTVNQQGTLNNYFDISFGSGTYAPRRKQAYSSKRLQQVVKDFRANQIGSDITSLVSDGPVDAPVPIAKSTQKKRPAQRTVQTRKRLKKNEPAAERPEGTPTEVDSHAERDINDDIPQPAAKARLRAKPKPRYKEAHSDEENNNDTSDSDDLFTFKRSRKA